MRISDWSSDVCSSDLHDRQRQDRRPLVSGDRRVHARPVALLLRRGLVLDSVIQTADTPLTAEDFRLTARSGFGDGWNHYAHSMAAFRGKVYVGTTRGSFAGLKLTVPAPDLKPRSEEHTSELQSLMS